MYQHGPCPACHGRFVLVVVHVDEDGTETVDDSVRCPLCGSPDAMVFVFQTVPDALNGR